MRSLLPRLLPSGCTFKVHASRGKSRLLRNLGERLSASWLPSDWRIVVMVDRDNDDCHDSKRQLEAAASNLRTRTQVADNSWQIAFRDRRARGLVLWRLGCSARCLSEKAPAGTRFVGAVRTLRAVSVAASSERFALVRGRQGRSGLDFGHDPLVLPRCAVPRRRYSASASRSSRTKAGGAPPSFPSPK